MEVSGTADSPKNNFTNMKSNKKPEEQPGNNQDHPQGQEPRKKRSKMMRETKKGIGKDKEKNKERGIEIERGSIRKRRRRRRKRKRRKKRRKRRISR